MNAATFLVAAALILFGRSLYWLLVGGIGFLVGAHYASIGFAGQADGTVLLVAIGVGVVGAVLAIVLQKVALALGGLLAGGYFAQTLVTALGGDPSTAGALAFLVGGVIAALAVLTLLEPALIVLSSIVGASMISQSPYLDPQWRWLVFAGLLTLGLVAQTLQLRRKKFAEAK